MASKNFYDKADKKLQRIAATIGAVIAITGALSGGMSWISSQFQTAVANQINELRTEVESANQKTELQLTRLELLNLISTQPNNVTEIERVARYYFKTLDGDWYATGIYSQWCKQYGGDSSIAIGD